MQDLIKPPPWPGEHKRPSGRYRFVVVPAVVLGGMFMLIAILRTFGIGGNQTEHWNVSIDVDPSGRSIVFSSASGQLYSLQLANRSVHQLTSSAPQKCSPRISPDGKSIAYVAVSSNGAASVCTIPLKGGPETYLTRNGNFADSEPSWSSDSKQLVFFRAYRHRPYSMGGMTWDDYDVCTLNIATGKIERRTHASYYSVSGASFVDGGRSIVFVATPKGVNISSAVLKVSALGDGSPHEFMPAAPKSSSMGAWVSELRFSNDYRRLTFVSDREQSYAYDIYVADSDGGNAKALKFTDVSRYNRCPTFDADVKGLYVLAGTERNAHSRPIFSLYHVDLSGMSTQIADSELFTNPTRWMPK